VEGQELTPGGIASDRPVEVRGGAIGRDVDAWHRTERKRRIKSVANTGNIQVFFRWTDNNITRFAWGGLRSDEINEILAINTSNELILNNYIDKYGQGEDDWILSVMTLITNSPLPLRIHKIYTVRGDGQTIQPIESKTYGVLSYVGSSLWASNKINWTQTRSLGSDGAGRIESGYFQRRGTSGSVCWDGSLGTFCVSSIHYLDQGGPSQVTIENIDLGVAPSLSPSDTPSLISQELGLAISSRIESNQYGSSTWIVPPRTEGTQIEDFSSQCSGSYPDLVNYRGMRRDVNRYTSDSFSRIEYGWISVYNGVETIFRENITTSETQETSETTNTETSETTRRYNAVCFINDPSPFIQPTVLLPVFVEQTGDVTVSNIATASYFNTTRQIEGGVIAPGTNGAGLYLQSKTELSPPERYVELNYSSPRIVYGDGELFASDRVQFSGVLPYSAQLPLPKRYAMTLQFGEIEILQSDISYSMWSHESNRQHSITPDNTSIIKCTTIQNPFEEDSEYSVVEFKYNGSLFVEQDAKIAIALQVDTGFTKNEIGTYYVP
jgi:hypothetical protein